MRTYQFPVSLTLAVVMSIGIARSALAQSAVGLGRATAAPAEAFSVISDVVELTPGRVLVADEKERRLALLDLASGAARSIGRIGSGPGEFRTIGRLFSRTGGAFLSDFASRRLLPITADGSFETPIPFPASIMLQASDTRGVLYGEAFLPNLGSSRSDSMFIVRWNPAAARFDTLTKYDAGVTKWTGRGVRNAYPTQDAWAPLGGGAIAIVHGTAYSVSVLRDGRLSRPTMIPSEPLRVTDEDKDTFLKRIASQPVRTLGDGATASAPPPMPAFQFPTHYPPFGGQGLGGRYVRTALNGDIWIERTRSERDSVVHYDVVDAAGGKLLARVSLPPRASVVGFGVDAVYVAERDEDDVAYVRRYRYPIGR